MRRWLITILLFLLLGAIVNVAVAWGCATWSPVDEEGWYAIARPKPPQQDRWWGMIYVWQGLGTQVHFGGYWQRPLHVSDENATSVTFTYSSWLGFTMEPTCQIVRQKWPRVMLPADSSGEAVVLAEQGCGWPLSSLWSCFGQWDESSDEFVFVEDCGLLLSGIVLDKTVHDARMDSHALFYRSLPLRPIWSGFVFNTVLYGLILWMLTGGPFILRRRSEWKARDESSPADRPALSVVRCGG